MTKKIFLIIGALLTFVCVANAQKEQNNWLFAYNAGLTWNSTQNYTGTGVYSTPSATLTGIPTVISGSPLYTKEGCFSVSNSGGTLQFFSDGMTVWNRNKAVMTNGGGLTGHPSSTQSGIIFPFPSANYSKYIAVSIFENTAGQAVPNNGKLAYSVIDMTQSGGLGSVTTKNVTIATSGNFSGNLGESVTAVRHANRNDYWILAVGRGATSYINVWKVTSAGVQIARHSVATVPAATNDWFYPGGYIKVSNDGKRFVWISFMEGFFAFGDFNNSTGTISNVKVRSGVPFANAHGYGVEFSPSGKYLYLTYAPTDNNANERTALLVYDFDILYASASPNTVAPVKSIINNQSITNGVNDHFGAVQLGPDSRMYISQFGGLGLFIIPNPDFPTSMKIYKLTNLLGRGIAQWGLPSFARAWFDVDVEVVATPVCAETSGNYIFKVIQGMGLNLVTKLVINFGDGTPTSVQTINSPVVGNNTLSYRYKKPGTYTITVQAISADNVILLTKTTQVVVNTCVLRVNPHIRGKF